MIALRANTHNSCVNLIFDALHKLLVNTDYTHRLAQGYWRLRHNQLICLRVNSLPAAPIVGAEQVLPVLHLVHNWLRIPGELSCIKILAALLTTQIGTPCHVFSLVGGRSVS